MKWILALLLFSPVLWAQESETELPDIVIEGGGFATGTEVKTTLDAKKVEQSQQLDINRILKEAPGVYVQEEDAYGLRPNIGLRGVYPQRSKKITFLEDGLLIGPAPYAAPAAYYVPSRSRMEAMEVYRGFSALPFGPNSVGGTVNDITKKISETPRTELSLQGGSFDFRRVQAVISRQSGDFSWLLVGDRSESSGFKELESGASTGFLKHDLMWKGRLNLSQGQSLEVKLGIADEISNETYLGLTEADFLLNSNGRYAASEDDQMKWRHQQGEVVYRRPSASGETSVAVYSRFFWRDWRRFNNFAGNVNVVEVLRNPTQGTNADYLDVLRGRLDSSAIGGGSANLIIANNERAFRSQGLMLEHREDFLTESWEHQLKIGLLLHQDEINRRHRDDNLEMSGGTLVESGTASTISALNQDQATARVGRASWESRGGPLTLAAAARIERIDYKKRNDLNNEREELSEDVFVPGAGLAYKFADVWEVFSNHSWGVTLQGPDVNSQQEKSRTTEFGLRRQGDFALDLTGFATKYDRLKGVCSFSSGCTDSTLLDSAFEGGSALIYGLESQASLRFDAGAWSLRPRLGLTLLSARFTDRFEGDANSEWGDGVIESGDPLPYVPERQLLAGFEIERGSFRQDWVFTWQSEMADRSAAADRRTIEAFGVVDVTTHYRWSEPLDLFVRVDNLLDNTYAVSERPFGLRPGKERSLILGLTGRF